MMKFKEFFDQIVFALQFLQLPIVARKDRDFESIDRDACYWLMCPLSDGGCWIGVEKPLAQEIAVCMYDLPAKSLSHEDIEDACKEAVNIVTGRLQSLDSATSTIGLPQWLTISKVSAFTNASFAMTLIADVGDEFQLFVGIIQEA